MVENEIRCQSYISGQFQRSLNGNTKSVWNISKHLKYFENQSHSFEVRCQPMREDLIAHVRTRSLPCGYSVGSEMLLSQPMYHFDWSIHNDKQVVFSHLIRSFFGKSYHTGLSVTPNKSSDLMVWSRLRRMK